MAEAPWALPVSSLYPYIQNVTALVQGTHRRRHWCWRRSRQGVCLRGVFTHESTANMFRTGNSYSLLFASRGANVVVNDFNGAAAQKVVDEIVKGACRP